MGVVSLQGSLLLVALFFYTVLTAPVIEENSALLGPDQIAEEKEGCFYNYEHYDEGDRILTNEPCLNCTCHNRMLMCYLRVCPFTKAIGQDCQIEKNPDQCCPTITCPQVHVALLTSSTTEKTWTTSAVGHPDNYGCVLDDSTFYADGAQVPSDPRKPCELCYCIRNQTACVMQECTLNVEGCKPVYQEGVCCPVRYDCDYDRVLTTPGPTAGLITTPGGPNECQANNRIYNDGEMIDNMTENPCEHCYCMRGEIVCAVQECGQPLENTECTPLPAEPGQCCPNTYQCPNGTVPAETLQAKPTPGADSLSITEKPHDEDKSIEEMEKHDESVEHSAEGIEQTQPEKSDISASSAPSDNSSEDSKIQAEIEIITTPVPQDLSEGSTQAVEQESGALLVSSAEQSAPTAEQDHVEETHDAEATTLPGHYTEISVVNVEMNASPPQTSQPEVSHEETPSENDEKETNEPVEAQELTTQPSVKQSEDVSPQGNDDSVSLTEETAVPQEPAEHQETILPEAPQETFQLEDEKPNEASGNEIPETTPAPSTSTTTEAELEELPRIPGEGSCLHKGITYAPNTEVASTDPCKRCRCVNSIVTCKELECAEPPFSQNSNCAPMPPADGACCPTYLCEQTPSEEPEAENHMSIDKIDMVVPDEEDTAEDSVVPTTLSSIIEQESIPSMVGIPEYLVPGTDEINMTPDQDVIAHETPASTQDEGKEQDVHPELTPAEHEVHEEDDSIAATTSQTQDSNYEDQAVVDAHAPAHDVVEESAEPSREPEAATTVVPLESSSEASTNMDTEPSGPSEVEQTEGETEGQAITNDESAPSTESPQEPSEVQAPNESPETSGTPLDGAPEQGQIDLDTEAPTAAPEVVISSEKTQETHSADDKEEESNAGTTVASISASEEEVNKPSGNEQTPDEVATNEPSPQEEVVPEHISTEGPSVSNTERDSFPSESSESDNLPTANDKENYLTGSNEETNPATTENPAQGSESSPSSEVEHVEKLQTTEGPSGSEEPVETHPIVTAGPPVLFPDIGHQGAPILAPGPAGINIEHLSSEDQRFGETESPVEQPSTTEQAQISAETSANSIENGEENIKYEFPPSTEGPNQQEESNVESSSEFAPIEESNVNESSQNPQSENLENGNEISQSEHLPSHDVEISTGQENEEYPATEQNQAAPETSPETSDLNAIGLGITEIQQHTNDDATPASDQLEEGPAPESENTQSAPIVTHGDLPSLPGSSQHPEENAVQPEQEPEHDKHEETDQPEHIEEPVPQSPEVPELDKTPGEADSEQHQSATQVPESDEVVTLIDVDRPQPSLESANQIIDAGTHDGNAVEENHQTISEEQKPEDNTETEKSQASEDQGEGESAATVPEAPESQPETPAHEESPEPSIPEHPEPTISEVPEHVVPEESLVESSPSEEPQTEEKPEEDHHEVPNEQLSEYTTPEPISPEADQHQTIEEHVEEELAVEKHPEADHPTEELPAEEHAVGALPAEENKVEDHPVDQTPAEGHPAEEHAAEDHPIEHIPPEEHPTEEHPSEEHAPTVEDHVDEISGPQVQDVQTADTQQPDHQPSEDHTEPEQPTHSEPSQEVAQEETEDVKDHQLETTPVPEEQASQEPQTAEQEADSGLPSGTPEPALTSDATQHETAQVTEDQQAEGNQETVPVGSSEDGLPVASSEAQHLDVNSETTPFPSLEQASEAPAIPEQSAELPTSPEPVLEPQGVSEEEQSIAGDKAESEQAVESAGESAGEQIPEQPTILSVQPTDAESQPTGSEIDTSGLGPITAPEELIGETGPSALETAPSAPETAPEQPSAPETAPEQPSAPESQPSSPGQEEVQPTSPESSAQPSHAEEISSQEESDKVVVPSPDASSSPLSEHQSGSPAPPVDLPSTEGPLMPGLQNWSQKPYHPTSHQQPAPEQQSHLPEDSHYPSPPYDTDYEDEDSVSYGPGTCRYGGKVYLSAQQIPRDDPCDFCFCFRSDIICLQQSCPPPIKGCYQETIKGFCCPRYECHVSMATVVNITTTSTTTTTTVPPHFLSHLYNGSARKAGCQVKGVAYRVGDRIEETSGPCLDCRCGADGQMKCDPTVCGPQESLLRQVMAGAVSKRRRR